VYGFLLSATAMVAILRFYFNKLCFFNFNIFRGWNLVVCKSRNRPETRLAGLVGQKVWILIFHRFWLACIIRILSSINVSSVDGSLKMFSIYKNVRLVGKKNWDNQNFLHLYQFLIVKIKSK
jgi:hypothetical protein